jgi:glutamate carboxypeptidase
MTEGAPRVLTAIERRVCDALARRGQALLDDLRLHVGLPTGGGNRTALDETRERLTARLQALGAKIELVPGDPKPEWLHGVTPGEAPLPTAVCRRSLAGEAAARSVLSGHMDTVHDPRGAFRELSIRPDGKTATGPGCVDMKGGLVIAMAALEALDECGQRLSWTFILNSDEETGSYFSASALAREARASVAAHGAGKGGACGLVFEPATPEGGLVVERAGSGQFMVECRGRSAHVGRDFTHGVSAVTALAKSIVRLGELPEPQRGLIINVGPLQGGLATNVVPDLARAWGNVRFPDPAGCDELGGKIDALNTSGPDLPATAVLRSFNRPAKPLTPGVQRLADAARAAAEALGQNLPFSKTAGVCDGNILQDAGLPTIDTLGVRGGGLHTLDEWIDLSSLVERAQMLAMLMLRLNER